MNNKPRDVSGGSQVWGAWVPGYGMATYLLGILSVPIETFLRRDFGERFYSRSSFIAGLVILILFSVITSLFGMLAGMFNPFSWFGGGDGKETVSWMGSIIKWYFLIGIAHFVTIWIRDVIGKPRHSYNSGTSWLLVVGKLIIRIMNFFAGLVVRLIARILPKQYREKVLATLPVFRNVTVFTERFVEPFVVLVLALYASTCGQTAVAMWLAMSFGALNLSTGTRHQAERAYLLDIVDQMIEAKAWQEMLEGKPTQQAERLKSQVQATISEVEKSPEVFEVIEKESPNLAKAIQTIQARGKSGLTPGASGSEKLGYKTENPEVSH